MVCAVATRQLAAMQSKRACKHLSGQTPKPQTLNPKAVSAETLKPLIKP